MKNELVEPAAGRNGLEPGAAEPMAGAPVLKNEFVEPAAGTAAAAKLTVP